MKWNWGTGLVVGMLSFMGFILYFVITMSTDASYKHDLVTKEYYAKEMAYQNEIDAETNTYDLRQKLVSKKTAVGWQISFPEELEPSEIKGRIFLYRPSNEKLDFELPLVLNGNTLLVPDAKMIEGRWNITIDWLYNSKPFMYKESILY